MNLAIVLKETIEVHTTGVIILIIAVMEKENKKKDKANSKDRSADVSAEKNIGKLELKESNESINDLSKIPGKGFGRLLGCG